MDGESSCPVNHSEIADFNNQYHVDNLTVFHSDSSVGVPIYDSSHPFLYTGSKVDEATLQSISSAETNDATIAVPLSGQKRSHDNISQQDVVAIEEDAATHSIHVVENVVEESNKNSNSESKGIQNQVVGQNSTGMTKQSLVGAKREKNWDVQYEALIAYANKYGNCNIRSSGYTADETDLSNLYSWLALQRRHKKQNKLRKDREAKLQVLVDSGKLSWVSSDLHSGDEEGQQVVQSAAQPQPTWDSFFDSLLAYTEDHGHSNVPKGHMALVQKRCNMDLGMWVKEQRAHFSNGNLEESHRSKLNFLASVGLFSWIAPTSEPISVPQNDLDLMWDNQFEAVQRYIADKGGCHVDTPGIIIATSVGSTFDLGLWVRCQRKRLWLKSLAPSRATRLNELAEKGLFSWLSVEDAAKRATEKEKKRKDEEILWQAWFNVLVWFGKRKGHCNIDPSETVALPDESEAELGKWLDIQKKILERRKMKPHRVLKFRKLIDEGKLPRIWLVDFSQLAEAAGFPPAQSEHAAENIISNITSTVV